LKARVHKLEGDGSADANSADALQAIIEIDYQI
jgi:hypothetical protein